MMNKKVTRLNPELDKLINDIKIEFKLPNMYGSNQIAQAKIVEFARIGKESYKRNKLKLKTPNPRKAGVIDFLDSITP